MVCSSPDRGSTVDGDGRTLPGVDLGTLLGAGISTRLETTPSSSPLESATLLRKTGTGRPACDGTDDD